MSFGITCDRCDRVEAYESGALTPGWGQTHTDGRHDHPARRTLCPSCYVAFLKWVDEPPEPRKLDRMGTSEEGYRCWVLAQIHPVSGVIHVGSYSDDNPTMNATRGTVWACLLATKGASYSEAHAEAERIWEDDPWFAEFRARWSI